MKTSKKIMCLVVATAMATSILQPILAFAQADVVSAASTRPAPLKTTKPLPKPVITTKPAPKPTIKPTTKPAPKPTITTKPAPKPTIKPTTKPAPKPTITTKPAPKPTVKPTTKPAPKPTIRPTTKPLPKPSVKPTTKPLPKPTVKPTTKPLPKPTVKPTTKPVVKNSYFVVDDFKAYKDWTVLGLLAQFGTTLNGESTTGDVQKKQGSSIDCALNYRDMIVGFAKGRVSFITVLTPNFTGPRDIIIGMPEDEVIAKFPNDNKAIQNAVKAKTSIWGAIKTSSKEYDTVFLYRTKDGAGYTQNYPHSEYDYQLTYTDYVSGYSYDIVMKNNVVVGIELHFININD